MLDHPVPEGSRSVSWPWYHHVLDKELTPQARNMLEDYSGIRPEDVEAHVYSIRDKAWGIFPWPCIGEFWFLSFGLSLHPLYHTMVLPRLKSGSTLLDLGSCLGQDIRRCIFDGAPASNLYASDLFYEYEDLSYDLWRDRDRFPPGHFLADDMMAENEIFTKGKLMTQLGPGQCDIICITMFLHLFNQASQLKAATRILRLLANKPGSIVLGSQAGSTDPGEVPLKPPFADLENGEKRTVYRHNPESFEMLWQEAGRAAGVPLKVNAVFQAPEDFGKATDKDEGFDVEKKEKKYFTGQNTRRLYFCIMRT